MHFKKHYLLFFAVFLAMVIFTAGCTETATPADTAVTPPMEVTSTPSIPNIAGVWTVTATGHSPVLGFRDHAVQAWNITEQNGQIFTGYKERTTPYGIEVLENFSGAVSYNGKTLYIADHDEGNVIGEFIGPDELELVLFNDGEEGKIIVFHLTRQEI